jgi:hypothetical protein
MMADAALDVVIDTSADSPTDVAPDIGVDMPTDLATDAPTDTAAVDVVVVPLDLGGMTDAIADAGVAVDLGPFVVQVRSMGVVTVGPTPATGDSVQVRDMSFEFGERQCSSGANPVCWIGGIIP